MFELFLIAHTLAHGAVAQPKTDPDMQDVVQPATDSSGEEAVVVEGVRKKTVCKTIRVTGSRFKEKICRVETQWEDDKEVHQQTMDVMRRDGIAHTGEMDEAVGVGPAVPPM